jgi:hypothetical protein
MSPLSCAQPQHPASPEAFMKNSTGKNGEKHHVFHGEVMISWVKMYGVILVILVILYITM